jgi:hypothetical protein
MSHKESELVFPGQTAVCGPHLPHSMERDQIQYKESLNHVARVNARVSLIR